MNSASAATPTSAAPTSAAPASAALSAASAGANASSRRRRVSGKLGSRIHWRADSLGAGVHWRGHNRRRHRRRGRSLPSRTQRPHLAGLDRHCAGTKRSDYDAIAWQRAFISTQVNYPGFYATSPSVSNGLVISAGGLNASGLINTVSNPPGSAVNWYLTAGRSSCRIHGCQRPSLDFKRADRMAGWLLVSAKSKVLRTRLRTSPLRSRC